MTKKAVILAIWDYPSWQNDLQGTKQDALNWHNSLIKNKWETISYLNNEVTIDNVKKILTDLVLSCNDNDRLIIVYTGHGSKIKDLNDDETDSLDETWCLYDGNFLDDDLKNIFLQLNPNCQVTVISDSCHSGTMLKGFNIPKIKQIALPHNEVEAREVLLSGCLPEEYSYEGKFNNEFFDAKAQGAFSYFAIKILNEYPEITFGEFKERIKEYLPSDNYPQHPQVECLNDMLERKIL